MIDLHTHTTASDGRCSPEELVERASKAGVTVLGVTDHDTVAGCARAAAACAAARIEFVPGIEITAVVEERDVHVLGYFVDIHSAGLLSFLAEQRQRRVDRIRQISARLAEHGIVLDVEAILAPGLTDATRSVGRPWIARALIAGGYVADIGEAFDRWLSPGKPGFVARVAAEPEEVFERIHDAGGLAALAHPVQMKHDDRIPGYAAAGMDALEVYHTDHDATSTAHYLALATSLNLAVTGGSDFHSETEHGGGRPGKVSLPRAHYERLLALRATSRATASGSATSS